MESVTQWILEVDRRLCDFCFCFFVCFCVVNCSVSSHLPLKHFFSCSYVAFFAPFLFSLFFLWNLFSGFLDWGQIQGMWFLFWDHTRSGWSGKGSRSRLRKCMTSCSSSWWRRSWNGLVCLLLQGNQTQRSFPSFFGFFVFQLHFLVLTLLILLSFSLFICFWVHEWFIFFSLFFILLLTGKIKTAWEWLFDQQAKVWDWTTHNSFWSSSWYVSCCFFDFVVSFLFDVLFYLLCCFICCVVLFVVLFYLLCCFICCVVLFVVLFFYLLCCFGQKRKRNCFAFLFFFQKKEILSFARMVLQRSLTANVYLRT